MSYSRRNNEERVGRVRIEEVVDDDDSNHSHSHTNHREPIVEQPDETPSYSSSRSNNNTRYQPKPTSVHSTNSHTNTNRRSRDPFGQLFDSLFEDDPFFSNFGRGGLSSFMDDDPFFSRRSDDDDLISSFMSDFEQAKGRIGLHNRQLTDHNDDDIRNTRALENRGQSYSFSSFSYSSSSRGGQTYEYTRSSSHKNNGSGRSVHEVQESERDSQKGVERMSIERGIGGKEKKSRKVIKERVNGGDVRSEEILNGVEEGRGYHFDEEWVQASESIGVGAPTRFDRYLSHSGRNNSHSNNDNNNNGVRGIEWRNNRDNYDNNRRPTYSRDIDNDRSYVRDDHPTKYRGKYN